MQKVAYDARSGKVARRSVPVIEGISESQMYFDAYEFDAVQIEGGFLAGVSLGLVPMGAVGQQLADAGEVLPHGTPEARLGLSVGMIVGGIAITVGGLHR